MIDFTGIFESKEFYNAFNVGDPFEIKVQ